MKKENSDGVVYRTKGPKMRVKDDWQIKLEIVANTDESKFNSHKEYVEYVEQHTKYAIEEQASRLKKAWEELDKQTVSSH